MSRARKVHRQYEAWPYPQIPLLASVRAQDTWQLNLDYLMDRCRGKAAGSQPRIWITGCGTFQPYVFGLANPTAQILASDISQRSLQIARRRCLWHGIYNVDYQRIDLEAPETWPAGPFDLIECYGVLMNLARPAEVLSELAGRLHDHGLLRIMVYPQFGRTRIFQIQRLAHLLGLTQDQPNHPDLLRRIMLALPNNHPLRFGFQSYADSGNRAGIVDGFLHAGDRGFTGHQLGELFDAAGLAPAFWFHRPWGQPRKMARALGLEHQCDSFVLHYLDLWQELRTNFVACLVKSPTPSTSNDTQGPRLHPLLALGTPGTPMSNRLRRLWHRVVGTTLPTRTGAQPIKLTGAELRALAGGSAQPDLRQRAQELGLLLGAPPPTEPAAGAEFHRRFLQDRPDPEGQPIQLGTGAANPFYAHLFQAFSFGDRVAGTLPPLAEQIQRWRDHALPPTAHGSFGLTPFQAHGHFADAVQAWADRSGETPTAQGYENIRLRDEERGLVELRRFLDRFPDLPRSPRSAAEERELFILLRTTDRLFLDIEAG